MDTNRHTILLPHDGSDFDHWRQVVRALWAQQIPPQAMDWLTEAHQQHSPDLFASTPAITSAADIAQWPAWQPPPCALTVSRSWLQQAEQALLNAAPERFAVLYRLLWRMQTTAGLRHDVLDADYVQMQHWIHAVRREVHKMHAFVRFRPVALPSAAHDGDGPLHVAWFEPTHHITQAAAPFFVRRFANMRWAILTPQCSLRWWPQAPSIASLAQHGITANHALQPLPGRAGVLSWGPGAQASDAPAPDAGEGLWLTYYAHTFNPARLKVATMRREMPRKYWHNLPEAQLITPLVQAAHARSGAMLANAATTPQRKLPRARPRAATVHPASDALSR